MKIHRSKAAVIARETLSILRAGSYRSADGETHNIRADIQEARRNTRDYRPDWKAEPLEIPRYLTAITVENAPTLLAAKRLAKEGYNVAALNFASARNAGGGFLNGALAQEEYLCRNSALFACLELQPFYAFHKGLFGTIYSSSTLYSPAVPVIRDENHLLIAPWSIAFLTAAAPNVKAAPIPARHLRAAFVERTRKVLSIAKENGHDALVLGAWGCGAFGNEPELVAGIWKEQLFGDFQGQFAKISFAVLNKERDTRNYDAFVKAFSTELAVTT